MSEEERSRAYYDEFSKTYDARRGQREPGGYHDLVDDLEVGFVERFARGLAVLEVGCGTGLILERIAAFSSRAVGVDLSPGMLEHARGRGLDARVGSATELPFADDSFDVACSFKVLAHVREVDVALGEMFRVVRPGGTVIAEFYNPFSLRALAKRIAGARRIGTRLDENDVFTRFDSPSRARARMQRWGRIVAERGIRIFTPTAFALRAPLLGPSLSFVERSAADGPARALAGFFAIAAVKPSVKNRA